MPDQKDGPVSPCFFPVRIPGELKFEDSYLRAGHQRAHGAGRGSMPRAAIWWPGGFPFRSITPSWSTKTACPCWSIRR